MEFRSCPACKASVLEDDVDDCPFCGTSMSAKPQATPPKKPAPVKPTAARPGAKSTPSTPVAGDAAKSPAKPAAKSPAPASKPGGEDSEDPFEVDTSALRRAIKLAPRPTKTRTHEVTCPMCETSGFMLPADAGKDVHCCNPECMVPVFKTQRPKVAEAPVEAPRDNRLLIWGGGGAALLIVAAAVWFLVLAPKPQELVVDDSGPASTPIDSGNLVPQNVIVKATDAPPATLAEIRTKSLATILDKVRQREKNRSIEYGTQLAAEAFAEAGDLTKAQEQVRRLQSTASQAPYLQVQPLVEIGWYQLSAGKTKEAQQTAASALVKAKNAPRSIRKTLDAATSLAALCIATGTPDAAQELIQRDQDKGIRGEFSAIWRAAVDCRTFQVDVELLRPWHVAMPEPMRVAVVETLVAHGQSDAALAFAASAENVASQAVCRAAWAGRITQFDRANALERVTTAIQNAKVPNAGQCQAWVAVASMAGTQDPALAKTALDNALAAAAKFKPAVPVAVPGMRQIKESEGKAFAGLPNPAPEQASALALSSLAILQLQLDQKADAWKSFQQSLEHVRAMAPSAILTQQLLDDCEKQEASVRAQLSQALNLGNNEQNLRTEFGRYRRQCGKLHAEAQQRLAVQVAILRFAAEQGLLNEAWTYIRDQSQAAEPQARDPFLETSLPGLIYSFAQAQGNAELVSSIEAAYTNKQITIDPLDQIAAQSATALTQGKLSEASDIIERAYRDQLGKKQPDRIDQIALRDCARAQAAATPDAMIPFIKNLYDVVIQEEAFLQLAGYSVKSDTAAQLWKVTVGSRELDALDFVAVYRGFIAGAPMQKPSGQQATLAPVKDKQ
ncbi:hypothetical protein SH661x_000440 [Planctomicrobium sp. SH661]|uniref:hypothetical protein n=1 Tax=Planctomicrobium sp. SH661 TaxID=3448124 RepID=UPI003F5C671D